uniref:Uncharacterized protein n=1 Tax=Mycena chlorophos TaxID=658473 RepID=A0ABQ0LAV0_MYCCL|nr:predicted protein [Mycena chlorophos]
MRTAACAPQLRKGSSLRRLLFCRLTSLSPLSPQCPAQRSGLATSPARIVRGSSSLLRGGPSTYTQTTLSLLSNPLPPQPPPQPPGPPSPPGSPGVSSRGTTTPPESPRPDSPDNGNRSPLGRGSPMSSVDEAGVKIERHPVLDGVLSAALAFPYSFLSGTPCDRNGDDLPPGAEAPPWDEREEDFEPFDNRAHFEFGEFLYTRAQMSGENIKQLMQHLAALYPEHVPPFANEKHLYSMLDALPYGDIPWQSFSVKYTGPLPDGEVPTWMTQKYQVWFRSPLEIFERQLANPDFKDQMDWAAKRIYRNEKRTYTDVLWKLGMAEVGVYILNLALNTSHENLGCVGRRPRKPRRSPCSYHPRKR